MDMKVKNTLLNYAAILLYENQKAHISKRNVTAEQTIVCSAI